MLFDLNLDIEERKNLAKFKPQLVDRLIHKLEKIRSNGRSR